MTDRYWDDELRMEDEATLDALETVRAAYISDELPRIGVQLTAVFTNGLPGRGAPTRRVPDAHPQPERPRRRWFAPAHSKALLAGLGAAVLSVNLAGIGSAGWLPGPLQSSFERVTRSVGLEVPAPVSRDRKSSQNQDRPGTTSEPGQPGGGTGGRTRGQTGTSLPSGQVPVRGQQPPGGGQKDATNPATQPPGPGTPSVTPVPTTRPAGSQGGQPPAPVPTTLPCVPATAPTTTLPPGPTLPTLPTVPTTVRTPIAGDATSGVPGPLGTLPVTPPDCPR